MNLLRKSSLLAVIAVLGLFPVANAQTRDNALKDVGKVNLIVEDVSQEATACGVTAQNIRDAFSAKLTGGPLTLVDDAAAKNDAQVTTIYVKADVMALAIENVVNAPCVTHIAVSLYDFQKVPLAATKRESFARVELWQRGRMFASAREAHGRKMSEASSQLAQDLLKIWSADNGR
ncbi:hypothetical protein ACVIGB_000971 [Bradyrhizobium sp. USDA 4341]